MLKLVCTNCENTFEIIDEDKEFYKKLNIPEPTFCPDCRLQRMLSWRNENSYYPRECGLCKKKVISVHSPENPYPVYCNKCWWGDEWYGIDYGRDFDFSRPFFDQFIELQKEVPQLAMMNDNEIASENCEYCQDFAFGKNCYLVTGSWRIRDSFYSNNTNHAQDIVDCGSVNVESELVYESVDCQKLYNCSFLQASLNCTDCHFGYDLKGCKDCFGCVGLRQKQYYIFNEAYSKDEYLKKMELFDTGSYEGLEKIKKDFAQFTLNFPRKSINQINCENCYGDNLYNCKNTVGYDCFNAENCKYFYKGDHPLYCYDIFQCGNPQWCCECITPDDSFMTAYSLWCWKSKHIFYSDNCHSSENLFGCISLRRAKNCILNKQYSEEEYKETRDKIIEHMKETGEWGQFFPIKKSPFGYNETIANDYFPMSKEEAVEKGYKWKDADPKNYQESVYKIPDHINDVKDDIVNEILACENCSKNYKIIRGELAFYKKMNLPIPGNCPDCRRIFRMKLQNPKHLWQRTCHKCGVEIQTAYSPQRPEKVYCEQCYLKEIV
jgi:Zn ribbon nucleic-acid-binding protein